MGTMASQISSLTIVYSTFYSGVDQRKHQSSASLAFVRGIHRWPVNFPHKWPVTRNMFPFDDVIMLWHHPGLPSRIQASRCLADRPLAVLSRVAEPNPVTWLGKNKHGVRYLSQKHYELFYLGALEESFVNKIFICKMSWHILPAKLIKFAMLVRNRKLAPVIRHSWAVRMIIFLIKSNTDEQQCPLTLQTNISNFGAQKYHINIES